MLSIYIRSSSQMGMDTGLFHSCFFAYFQRSLFLFLMFFFKYYFTLVSVVFLNPFMDFDSVLIASMQVHVCVSRMEVPSNVPVTIGEDKYFTLGQV